MVRLKLRRRSPPSPSDAGRPVGATAYRQVNVAVAIAGFTGFALLHGAQPILPQLAHEFRVSPGVSSLVVAAGTAAMAMLLIPLSMLSDRYGRRPLMRAGLVGASVLALASSLAPDFWSLVICRACLGVCIAGVPAAAMAYLGEEVAVESQGRAMGIYIGATALGGMSGRLLSALVTGWANWRFGLAVLGLLGALATLAFWRLLPPGSHFQPRSLQPRALLCDLRQIYTDAELPWLFAVAFLIMGAFVGFYNYLGFRLSLPPYGFGAAAVGAIFMFYAIGSFSAAWAVRAAPRHGEVRFLLWMSGLMMVGAQISLAEALPLVIAGLALFTFGYFALHAVASSWVGRRGGGRRGLVSALYLSSYYLGGSVIGSATGWSWQHGGWPDVVMALSACSLCSMGILLHLRGLAGR